MPTWATVTITLASPVFALVGAYLGLRSGRVSAGEQDRRWRREETMRRLQWAVGEIVSVEERRRLVGIAVLDALDGSDLLAEGDVTLVRDVVAVLALDARTLQAYPRDSGTAAEGPGR